MLAKISQDENSVTIEKDGKKYVVYFDQDNFAVYVENENVGSFATVTLPTCSGGHANFEYWENW